MEQKKASEESDSAPTSRLKIGGKVAPAGDATIKHAENSGRGQGRPVTSKNRMNLPNIKMLKRLKPRAEEEITKCQTKCFFVVVGAAIAAFGTGLTIYGEDADLRDFLILGPSMLIIGFILMVIGLILICKDVYILNKAAGRQELIVDFGSGEGEAGDGLEEDKGLYYNMKPPNALEVAQANNRRMDLYTVTSSRPHTVASLRSDGALTTSELLLEQGAGTEGGSGGERGERDTPDPVVPTHHPDSEVPIKSVPHPRSERNSRTKTEQNSNDNRTQGSTITVKSSDDCDDSSDTVEKPPSKSYGTPVKTRHGSVQDSTDVVQNRVDSTRSSSTFTVQMRVGGSSSQDSTTETTPQAEASYCSPVRLPRQAAVSLDNEPLTTDL